MAIYLVELVCLNLRMETSDVVNAHDEIENMLSAAILPVAIV